MEADTVFTYNPQFTIDTVQYPRTFVAVFEQKTITITTEASPQNAGTTQPSSATLLCGDSLTVTATANIGYKFVNWTLNGVEVDTNAVYTFQTQGNAHLIAHFEEYWHNIVLIRQNYPDGMTYINGIPSDGGTFPNGIEITIGAEANPCFDFITWMEDDAPISEPASFNFIVDRPRILTAVFDTATYNVIAEPNNIAYGDVIGDTTGVHCGYIAHLVAIPKDSNFIFVEWTENGIPLQGSDSIDVPIYSSRHFIAHFQPKTYYIKITRVPDTGGTTTGGGYLLYGSKDTITATPFAPYNFYHWEEWTETDSILIDLSPTHTYSVTGPRHFAAIFTPKLYTITVSTDPPGGSGGIAWGGGEFAYGQTDTVYAQEIPPYRFKYWSENGEPILNAEATYPFTVIQSRHLVGTL